jgi:hypothetical protein
LTVTKHREMKTPERSASKISEKVTVSVLKPPESVVFEGQNPEERRATQDNEVKQANIPAPFLRNVRTQDNKSMQRIRKESPGKVSEISTLKASVHEPELNPDTRTTLSKFMEPNIKIMDENIEIAVGQQEIAKIK